MKKLFKIFLLLCLIGIAIVVWCSHIVEKSSRGKLFNNVNDIPCNDVGLLLGTNPIGRTGRPNIYYVHRIQAVVDLYKAGKIKVVLISGDNSHRSYNEPEYMKKDLVSKGIPADRIFLDYAGFRTFDSMIRAQKVFGQNSFTIISQEFHNQRALYICQHLGIDAVAFNAKNTISRIWRVRMYFREKLARTKAVLDILFGKKPHFLGDPIPITIPKDTISLKDTTNNMGLKDLFHRKRDKNEAVQITIPEESFDLIESTDPKGAKALIMRNASLKQHQKDTLLKQVFGFYCSINLDYVNVDENNWPTSEEFSIMQDYTESIDQALKVQPDHPNALFVARVTYNGVCQVVWMLNNPEIAIEYLDGIIAKGNQIREFDYSIEKDPEWKLIDFFLQDFPKSNT